MMNKKRLPNDAGMSLMEVTLAVAVFAIAIAFTAQAIMTNYAALDLQEQRIAGIQASRAVMAELREQRAMFRQGMDNFDTGGYLAWIEAQNDNDWESMEFGEDSQHLQDMTVTVEVFNPETGAAAANNTNPLEVHVLTTWTDRMGRPMEARIVSLLAER